MKSLSFIVILISQCYIAAAADTMSFYGYSFTNKNSYDLMYIINPTNIILLGKYSTSDGYETFKVANKFTQITSQKGYIYPKYYVYVSSSYDSSLTWWKPSEYQIDYTYSSCDLSSKSYTTSYILLYISVLLYYVK